MVFYHIGLDTRKSSQFSLNPRPAYVHWKAEAAQLIWGCYAVCLCYEGSESLSFHSLPKPVWLSMGTVQAISECLTKSGKVAEVSHFCMRRGDSLSLLVPFDFSQGVRGWLGVSEHEVLCVIYPLKACIPSTQVSEIVPVKDLSGLAKAFSAKGVRHWRQKRNDNHNYSKGSKSEMRRAGSKGPDSGSVSIFSIGQMVASSRGRGPLGCRC